MRALYTAEQSRDIDQMLIEQTPVDGYELMQRAARACFAQLIRRWPQVRNIIVYAGVGNNGGDGYILANLLRLAGRNVTVCQCGDVNHIKGDALKAHNVYLQGGGKTSSVNEARQADLVVDAIFGSGLNRELSEPARGWINRINAHNVPVLAVDIPSGLDADRGVARPDAVNADITVTFITRKQGMYTAGGKDHCGEICFSSLQCSDNIIGQIAPSCRLLNHAEALQWLPSRPANSHKKNFGHVLVIGGNYGMAGAICLTAKASLYSGAGLVSVVTRKQHIAIATTLCPPLMVYDAAQTQILKKLIHNCDIIVIGPGLGSDAWSLALMSEALDSNKALVVDADALHLLAKQPSTSEHWILTPHPGEAAHLLNTTSDEVQGDRFAVAREIQNRYHGVCVLKGAGTIVASSSQTTVCEGGNPGMSSAGMGDVLSGIIAALQGQGLEAQKAALLGTCAHNRAGDLAATNMPRGLSADVVINYIPAAVNKSATEHDA